jgi:hypothetical protein
MGVSQITLDGRKVIYVNCSNISTLEKDVLKRTLDQGNMDIARCGPKAALVITDITNVTFDNEVSELFKSYASKNTPYVKASSIVGLSGLQYIMFSAIKALTKREFYIAKSLEDAKTYMSKQ